MGADRVCAETPRGEARDAAKRWNPVAACAGMLLIDNREEASCVTVAGDRVRPNGLSAGGPGGSRDEVSSEGDEFVASRGSWCSLRAAVLIM